MVDIEKVKQGLRCCDTTNCNDCPFNNEKDETYPGFCQHVLNHDSLSMIEELQAEIEQLKEDNTYMKINWIPVRPFAPDCQHAEHDGTGCLGYCGSEQDDEPIDACKECYMYTGKEGEDDGKY